MSTPSYFEGSNSEPVPSIDNAFDRSPWHDPDVDDVIDAEDQPAATEREDTSKKTRARKPARATAKITAAQVRRVLKQAEDIEELSGPARDLLAAAIGSGTTATEDLVVATLSGAKGAAEAIDGLRELIGEDDVYNAVVIGTAIASDRDTARRTWGLLTALDKVQGAIPAKEVQAGAKIASAAKSFTSDDIAGLDKVIALLG